LLKAVATEVQGRLDQSLHNAVWLALGMERQDYRVQRPWSATVKQEARSAVPLEAGTRVVEVFDQPELNRQLLILGEPGAGKTTMMLELAEDLVGRSQMDRGQPIPVLVSLSSWKPSPQNSQSFFDWLVMELKAKYGLRSDLGKKGLEQNQLLPLLDGLDEVAPQHQRDCAIAINAWLTGNVEQRPYGVLICCRREEFEQVVREPLSLYGAVYLKALRVEQVEDYFERLGLADVGRSVLQDEALLELLTKPLFLSMFGLVQMQGAFSLEDWAGRSTSESRIEYLLDTYWDAAMNRRLIVDPSDRRLSKAYGTKTLPKQEVIQRALVFAAKALDQESSTELLIERMQPSCLQKEQQEIYRLLFSLFLILPTVFVSRVIYFLPKELLLLLFTFPTLKYFVTMNRIIPAEKLEFKKLSVRSEEDIWAIRTAFSLISITCMGFIWLSDSLELRWLYFLVVPISGVGINMSVAWLFQHMRAEISNSVRPNQGIKDSWKSIIIFVIFVLLATSLLSLRFHIADSFIFKDLSYPVVLS
jgi:GTPase SAR1 family protein